MDANLTQRRRGLEEKIPDIQKTLGMVEYLNERRVSEFVYFISDFPHLLIIRLSPFHPSFLLFAIVGRRQEGR